MIDPKRGALAAAAEEPMPDESATLEMPAQEQAAPAPGGEAPAPGGQPDPRLVELFQLVVGRAREGLAKVADDLDAALKADPIAASVEYGTGVLRKVAQAAEKAGKPLPLEAIMSAGMQLIKDFAEIAVEKGYMPEDQIEPFLKEVFQKSMTRYTQMDMADGLISKDQIGQVQQAAGMGQPKPRGALAQGAM